MSKRLSQVFNWHPLSINGGDAAPYAVQNSNEFVAGVELEIEDTGNIHRNRDFFMEITDDGSLRNHGEEFITYPCTLDYLSSGLEQFYLQNQWRPSNFSDRCSIHVHVNIRELEPQQLASLILLYVCFEKSLFNYVQEERIHNIFCVPLQDVNMGRSMSQFLSKPDEMRLPPIWEEWSKYAALNLKPIRTQGSIEFRHMHGSCNPTEVQIWLKLLAGIYNASISQDYSKYVNYIQRVNTVSNYRQLAMIVFGDFHDVISDMPSFMDDVYLGAVRAKGLLV